MIRKKYSLLAYLMILVVLCTMLPIAAFAGEETSIPTPDSAISGLAVSPVGDSSGTSASGDVNRSEPPPAATYTVTADSAISGGSLVMNPTSGAAGVTVTVTATPDSGKQLLADSLKYSADNGSTYMAITASNGMYSFTMPEADVVVTAQFSDISSQSPPVLNTDTTNNIVGQPIELNFTDDVDWRAAISGMSVDGSTVDPSKYTIAAGIITIDQSVFTSAKDYVIVVSAGGYTDASVTQTMSAASSNVWDGSVDVSWYDTTGTAFYISTPGQLAGLAALVNGHIDPNVTPANKIIGTFTPSTSYWTGTDNFKNKTIYLTADLDMGGVYNSASGTWSGPNYTPIGGQWCPDLNNVSDNTVLSTSFNGTLDGQGHTVKNIYCNRFVSQGYTLSQSIALVGRLGCHDDDDVSLWADNPTVRNVVVNGYFYGRRSMGGIVGKIGKTNKGGIIENCANFATVHSTDSKGCGGIVGAGWNGGVIRNCYNAGNISSEYNPPCGGISGSNEDNIYNCYNIGNISAASTNFAMGIGSNDHTNETVDNCYWLTGSAPGGGYYVGDSHNIKLVSEKSTGEMKSTAFLATLNGDGRAFVADTSNINNGFPILRCQTGDATYATSITKESDPTKLSYIAGENFDPSGLVIWANYNDGTREKITNYTISKATSLETTDTTITVSGTRGGMAYSFGFPVVVSASTLTNLTITTPAKNLLYASGESFNPSGMVVNATYSSGLTIPLAADQYTIGPAVLSSSDTRVTISYTYSGVTLTADQPVTVLASTAPVKNTDNVYELSSSDDMLWFANQVNSSLNTGVKGKLMNDIDLSQVTWKPIGANVDGMRYTGVFDGSGKTVTLAVNSGSSCNGLFGCMQGATVKNLTVAGTVTGVMYTGSIAGYIKGISVIENCVNNAALSSTSQYLGGIAGYAIDDSKITGCTNNGTVASTVNYTGGIAGYTSGIAAVTGCTNNGAVSATYNVGGIVGYDYGTCTISKCANSGTVTATSTSTSSSYSVGGVVGYAYAATTVDQCYNTGAVKGGVMNTGGVIGYLYNASSILTNSYNTASITSTCTSGTARTGGVVGYTPNAATTVQKCYNAGAITGNATSPYTAGVIGYATGNTNLSNNYFLNTTAAKGLGYAKDNTVSKTSDELKALAPTLGQYYMPGAVYPILSWQAAGAAAPSLLADTTDNSVGKAVDITFADDAVWRGAISDVTVNGTSMAGQYSLAPGVININAGVFTAAGDYAVVVKAGGYNDAMVTQVMQAAVTLEPGDINGDGVVNNVDVVKAVNFALEISTPTAEQFTCADMNGDGIINNVDVVKIVNKALQS